MTALENSFNNYPNADGFLQVSGISYTFNASTAIGSRLSDIMIDGHKLDDARTYIVATTNILADTLGYRSEATGRIGSISDHCFCCNGLYSKEFLGYIRFSTAI